MALPDRSWSQIRPSLAMKSHPRFIETRAAVGNVSRQGRRALFAVGRDVRQAGVVDYENVHKIDLSILDETYRAVVFVGASQQPLGRPGNLPRHIDSVG
jgi:hypothetical protein